MMLYLLSVIAVIILCTSCQPRTSNVPDSIAIIEDLDVTAVRAIVIESGHSRLEMKKKKDLWYAILENKPIKLVSSRVNALLLLMASEPQGLVMDYTEDSLKNHALSWPVEKQAETVRLTIELPDRKSHIRFGKLDLPHNPNDAQIMGVGAVARRFVLNEESKTLSLVNRSFVFLSTHLSHWIEASFHPVNRIQSITVKSGSHPVWTAKRESPFHSFSDASNMPLIPSVDSILGNLFEAGYYTAPILPSDKQLLADKNLHTKLSFKNFDQIHYEIDFGGSKVIQLSEANEGSLLGEDEQPQASCYAARVTITTSDGVLLEKIEVFLPRSEVDPILVPSAIINS